MMTQTRPEPWKIQTKNGPLTLIAERLATGTSHERLHTHLTEFAARYEKCHACRWYEIAIYRVPEGTYVVHTAGRSVVPGEETWYRVVRAPEPSDVIDALVVSKDKGTHVDRFITRPAQDALEHASEVDRRLDGALGAWVESDAAQRVNL